MLSVRFFFFGRRISPLGTTRSSSSSSSPPHLHSRIIVTIDQTLNQGSNSSDKNSKNQSGLFESNKIDGKSKQEPNWHTRGVAARAIHLSRGVEKPSGRVTYTVVLEGLSRFSVQEINTKGTYTTARISPIDMTKAEMEHVEQEADFIALSRQFKVTAMELIFVLEQKQKTGGRTKVRTKVQNRVVCCISSLGYDHTEIVELKAER